MIGSEIKNILSKSVDGNIEIVLDTSAGFYKLNRGGFKGVSNTKDFETSTFYSTGVIINEVRSDVEYCVIKLSDGNYLVYGPDAISGEGELFDGLKVKESKDIDIDFQDWYDNHVQKLSEEKSFYGL